MKLGAPLLGLMAVLSLASSAVSAQREDSVVLVNGREMPAYREGEVIVKYKDGGMRTLSAMNTVYSRAQVLDVKRFSGVLKNFEHLTFDTQKLTVDEVISDLERDPSVEYVQPNYIVYALKNETAPQQKGEACFIPGIPYPPGCVNPNAPEPQKPTQPQLPAEPEAPVAQPAEPEIPAEDDTVQENAFVPGRGNRPGIQPRPADVIPAMADPSLSKMWAMSKIQAQSAWAKTTGSRRVIVAVIDSGIDYNHPDLAGNMWRNPNASRTRATGVDQMGSSISGDVVGWNFIHNDNLPYDDSNHGTHVAGTIGAVGGNGKGISGINKRVSLMAVKFIGSNGSGDTANAIRAIDYAISRGAKVLNNSWGGRTGVNKALRDAIVRAERAGALFVAAAGNEANNNDVSPTYPASYNLGNVISVAATTSSDGFASFSNRGARTVHMGAPGQSIYSTIPGGRYGTMSGTSMAAPHVAGAAALIWSRFPNLTVQQVKQRLLNGDPLRSLAGRTITGKRLNLNRALQ